MAGLYYNSKAIRYKRNELTHTSKTNYINIDKMNIWVTTNYLQVRQVQNVHLFQDLHERRAFVL
jgi:hypothetical protein